MLKSLLTIHMLIISTLACGQNTDDLSIIAEENEKARMETGETEVKVTEKTIIPEPIYANGDFKESDMDTQQMVEELYVDLMTRFTQANKASQKELLDKLNATYEKTLKASKNAAKYAEKAKTYSLSPRAMYQPVKTIIKRYEKLRNRFTILVGMGEKDLKIEEDGDYIVVSRSLSPILGATYTRLVTNRYSVSVTYSVNQTYLVGIGYDW